MVCELTPRTGGNHSVGSNLDVVIYLFIALSLYLFSVYFFSDIFLPFGFFPRILIADHLQLREIFAIILTNNSSPRHSTSAECE